MPSSTGRAAGHSLERLGELNAILRGWRQYFRLDNRKGVFAALDIHIRRHLRKLVWIAWKRPRTRERELQRRGLDDFRAWKSANNGRGAWWNANARHMRDAFPLSFFKQHGLYSLPRDALSPLYTNSETAGCRTARPERSALIEHCGVGGECPQGHSLPDSARVTHALG